MTEREARAIKLTEHFSLWEFLRSDKAEELGLMEQQLDVSDEVIDNLKALCINVLEPLRLAVGTVIVKSGYRCPALNEAVGGSKSSQHLKGEAVDIVHAISGGNRLMFQWLRSNTPFDQLINEYDYSWVHVSYSKRHRRQVLAVR